MIENYVVTFIIDIVALLLLASLIQNNNILSRHRKRPFVYGIVITMLVIIAEAGTLIYGQEADGLRHLHIFFNVVGFSLTPWIPIVLIAIFDIKAVKTHLLLLLPTFVNMVVAVLSPWYGLIFFVDGNNHYGRGPFFVFFVVVYLFNLLLLVIGTHQSGQKYLYTIRGKIFGLAIFTIAGTFIQLLIPSIISSWHCVTLSLFLYYILLTEFDGSFDALTGMFNRAAFEKESKRLKKTNGFTVIILDINFFKEINDTYGHDYGDLVLKTIAFIIKNTFGDGCNGYRIGGDEFCVIIKETNEEKIEVQLRQMTDKLGRERLNDIHLPTVSYGYSIHQKGEALDFQKNMKEADNQMYIYKQYKQLHKNNM